MRNVLIATCLAAAAWLGTGASGIAAGGSFTRGCAARDIQVMMMLETNRISASKVDDAVRTILHARMMCFDGQVVDALALYDDVAHSINSEWMLSSQGQ